MLYTTFNVVNGKIEHISGGDVLDPIDCQYGPNYRTPNCALEIVGQTQNSRLNHELKPHWLD